MLFYYIHSDKIQTVHKKMSASYASNSQSAIAISNKAIAISKIVFQSFIAAVPKHTIKSLEKIKKAFLWKTSTPKKKHENLCNEYQA